MIRLIDVVSEIGFVQRGNKYVSESCKSTFSSAETDADGPQSTNLFEMHRQTTVRSGGTALTLPSALPNCWSVAMLEGEKDEQFERRRGSYVPRKS